MLGLKEAQLIETAILEVMRKEILSLPRIKESLDSRDQATAKLEVLEAKEEKNQVEIGQVRAEITVLKEMQEKGELPPGGSPVELIRQLAQKKAELSGLQEWSRSVDKHSAAFRAVAAELQKTQTNLENSITGAFNQIRPRFEAQMNELLEKATAVHKGWLEAIIALKREVRVRHSFLISDQPRLSIDSQKSVFIYFGHRHF